MSYKPEVIVDDSNKWYGNSLRFATEKEAYENATDLMQRWMAVRDFRASVSVDPVNYSYINRELVPFPDCYSIVKQ